MISGHPSSSMHIHAANHEPHLPERDETLRKEMIRVALSLCLAGGLTVVTLHAFVTKKDIRSKAAITGPMLAILPNNKTVKLGEKTAFVVSLASSTDKIAAVALEIPYDRKVFTDIAFVPGALLPVILSPPVISDGKLRVTLGAGVQSPYSGTGILGTIWARGISPATTTLGFGEETAVASIGKTVNSLTSKTNATVKIAGASAIATRAPQMLSPTIISVKPPSVSPIVSSSSANQANGALLPIDQPTGGLDLPAEQEYSSVTPPVAVEQITVSSPVLQFFQNLWSLLTSLFR